MKLFRQKTSNSLIAMMVSMAVIFCLIPESELVAKSKPVEIESLKPNSKHRQITKLVKWHVDRHHYKKLQMDDALSRQILHKYIKNLDPNRSYFLSADIKEFDKIQDDFDDYLLQGELTPAYEIFKIYRKRVEERVDFALHALDNGFDFERDENYQFDRSEDKWARNKKELDDIWRKRIKNDVLNLRLAEKTADEIKKTLTKRYGQLDRRTKQLDADDVFQLFVNAYVTTIEPHTSYFAPQAADSFKIHMSLSLEGIGAVLHTDDEYTVVRRIVTGGPADMHGELKPGDRIVGVAQGAKGESADVFGWRLDDVVDLIRGKKGSEVRLEILPADAAADARTHEIVITRDKIKLEEQAAQKSVIDIEGANGPARIGVIDLPTFYIDFDGRARGDTDYRSTTRDVRKLLEELKEEKVDGIVIDLRGNGGGALSEATALTGLFIESGPIVQVRDSTGRIELNNDPDPSIAYTGPLAVLVDRYSASASEIFSGAIQDYRRGLIIGEPTFGKGTVQQLISLDRFSDNNSVRYGQLKVTTAQFFRVNGDSTQHRGVVPDVVYPTASSAEGEGERALENALPWATVEPTSYQPFASQLSTDAFVKTRSKHSDRLHSVPALRYLLEGVELQTELRERDEISLMESQRRSDRKIQEEKEQEINRQLRIARGLPPVDEERAKNNATGKNADNSAELGRVEDDPSQDILLAEAGRILADYVSWQNPTLTVQRTDSNSVSIKSIPVINDTSGDQAQKQISPVQ